MIRRSHKKSRQGCTECKQSHKKCDESRPACVNCTTAQKQCSFSRNTNSQSPNDKDLISCTETDDLTGSGGHHISITSVSSSPRPLTPAATVTEPYVNLLHLELFHNVASNAISFFTDDSPRDLWVTTLLQYTFAYPFLMYETLAISAFHLSIKHPSKSDFYLTESTALQSQALSLFKSSSFIDNQDKILPAFLFSSVLGLHFFCETFSVPSLDLNAFLDRLVQSIQLLRGIRAMVGDSWEFIKNSEIKPLLVGEGPVVDRDDDVTHAFEDLYANISQSYTLSAFEIKVYCEAITKLIWVYNSRPLNSVSDGRANARMVMTWPITISAEYTELLQKRKPEALVVLAYFSILLHGSRALWAVGDAGRFLLNVIGDFLGEGWDKWLTIPRSMVPRL
ncbi:hypothetical protein BGZ60DRAFT_404867 [Tricladium varicosporioides]|nr:hypothetical protein BGZ60DRAFT_404867 [Hymenoscyphus varicosporioides]